jgi:hypothetical protein
VPLNEDGGTFGIVEALACEFLSVAASVIDEAPIPTVVGELADVLHPHAAESARQCKMVSRLDRQLRRDLAPEYVEPLSERVYPTDMQRRDNRRELVHAEHQVDHVGHDVWLVWRAGLLFIAGHEGRDHAANGCGQR